jgi:hypothetical protein
MKPLKKAIVAGVIVLLAGGVALLVLFRHDLAHKIAITSGEHLVDKGVVTVSDLSGHVTIPADNFDRITSFREWSMVPRDFNVFNHVPFQIDGMTCLWGANNAKEGFVMPEEALDVGIKGTFETLYIYHATFYASPAKTPVYEVVFRYNDGSSITNKILYGDDVFDWFTGRGAPGNPRSRVAWRGAYKDGGKTQELSFYMTAINNPYSRIPITSVDLFSCKSGSAACIGALTAGPANLMR